MSTNQSSIKGCGNKSVYLQVLAILWKYTDLLPHPSMGSHFHPYSVYGWKKAYAWFHLPIYKCFFKKCFYLNVQYFFLIVSQEVKKTFITVVHIMSGYILFFTSCNGYFKCHLYLKYVILLWQSMSARSNFEPWALDMPQNSDQMTNCLTLHNILGLMCHQNLWYRAQCFHQYNIQCGAK